MDKKRLDFIFFEAGGGHRAAANALKTVIEQQRRPWEVRLVNLQELLDPLDIFRKYTGIRMQDIYNLLLKKGWTLGSPQLIVADARADSAFIIAIRSACCSSFGRKTGRIWWFR